MDSSDWFGGNLRRAVSRLARSAFNVRVVAETSADRLVVEAIGRSGSPVRFTVKRKNLAPLQPGLFD